jgi:hypothetical protein
VLVFNKEIPESAVLEPGGVGQQMLHGNGLSGERVRDLEVLQIRVDVGVEVDLPPLDELHHGSPGEELRDRAGTKERPLGIDGAASVAIGVPVALGEEELSVLDDGNGRGRDVIRAHLRSHGAVEERFELLPRLRLREGRSGREEDEPRYSEAHELSLFPVGIIT